LGVFAIAVSTAALPSLSRQAVEPGLYAFKQTLSYAMRLVFFITLPAMTGLIVLAPLIVRVLFERGAFDPVATQMTARALVLYSVGLWAFSGIRVLVAAFYALQDTKTPVKAATMALFLNAGLSLSLMGPLAHGGLALALSLASGGQFIVLGLFLQRYAPGWASRDIAISLARATAASAVMGAVLWWAYRVWWSPGPGTALSELIPGLAGLLALGCLIYFAIMYPWKDIRR
jgi:putative peptidoglycan lipid II flippase